MGAEPHSVAKRLARHIAGCVVKAALPMVAADHTSEFAPGKQAKANKHEAERYADALRPILVELCHMRVETIADELMRRKIGTPRGGRWHGRTVARLLDRLHLR